MNKWDLRTTLAPTKRDNLDGWGQYSRHLAVESWHYNHTQKDEWNFQ